jgi:hypothetical protein
MIWPAQATPSAGIMTLDDLPEPPQPPDAPRRFRLYRYQWAGLAILSTLPILAIAGTFGETWSEATLSSSRLEVTVRVPTRYRYKQLNQIEVQVRNRTDVALDTVRVALDTAFTARFSTVRSIPAFARPFEAELVRLEPGETRLVLMELQAERYGRHRGTLTVAATDTLRMPLSVTIFP